MAALACLVALALGSAVMAEDRPVIWHPPADWCCTLRDIASRLPKNTDAYDPDPITHAHEGSHFLSQGRGAFHGVYVGEGRLHYVPIPPLDIDDVFLSMPPEQRGPVWNTYRKQGQSEYWRRNAIMLCDEWNAYRHGSQVRREMGIQKRQESDRYCAELARYTARMYTMARDLPDYDHTELRSFCNHLLTKCRATIPEWDELASVKFD